MHNVPYPHKTSISGKSNGKLRMSPHTRLATCLLDQPAHVVKQYVAYVAVYTTRHILTKPACLLGLRHILYAATYASPHKPATPPGPV